MYFEGLKLARLGLSSTCLFDRRKLLFDNGEKGRRTQKSGASDLKNQAEAPLHLVQSLVFAI